MYLRLDAAVECPPFSSAKERHRFGKGLIAELDRELNKHTLDLGDWPLAIRGDFDSARGVLHLQFTKALEPDEDSARTQMRILTDLEETAHLRIRIL